MNTEPKSKNVPIPEIAEAMDMGVNTIYSAAKRGELPFPVVRVGKRFFVPRGPFEEFMQTGRATSHAPA